MFPQDLPENAKQVSTDQLRASFERMQAGRAAARAKPVTFKTEFLDEDAWIELAHAASLRLPEKRTPATSASITKWSRKVGIGVSGFHTLSGLSPTEWCQRNNWSLRGAVGLMLEYAAGLDGFTEQQAARVDIVAGGARLDLESEV
jgi:hypothetical protein